MKKITIISLMLICYLLTTQTVNAQIIYGLTKAVSGSPTLPFDITSVDPFTGTATPLYSTNSLVAVAAGASTYDQQNQRYITWGFDNSFVNQLYVADIDSGTVVTQAVIGEQPIEMEYDLKQQQAYGLWYTQNMQHFGTIDLTTGATTSIATLPTVSAIAIGNSTFDSNQGRYIFVGIENNTTKLITLNAATGTMVNSVAINTNGQQIAAFEFNVNTNKLHALYNQVDSSMYDPFMGYYRRVLFSEVDIFTGNVTVVDTTPVNEGFLTAYGVGGIAFDQASQSYIGILMNINGFNLKMIDALTGQVISSIPLPDGLIEIQCDNYTFAQNRYSVTTSNNSLESLSIAGKVFPNPTTGWLNIEVDSEIEMLSIHDLTGRKVLERHQFNQNGIDISGLNTGVYTLTAQTESGIFTTKFIKK